MAHERILVVDDNAVNLKLTRALLAVEGYEIATAASAEEALSVLAALRPQLILTDIKLTGMDGLELTRRLKSSAEWKAVPVIALTGLDAAEDQRQALAAGCSGFLSKPVKSQVLRSLVRKHLAGERRAPPGSIFDEDLIAPLREEFRSAGADKCRRLVAMLPVVAPHRSITPLFDYRELGKALHGWAGGGGTFGLPRITEKAREAEALLKQPLEQVAVPLRAIMESLLEMFTQPLDGSKPATAVSRTAVQAETAGRQPTILICDDDSLVVAVIKATLEADGMLCRTAGNGRLAFAMACENPPDAVILDVNMPALDGFQVLDELRRLEATSKVKVMLLTGRYEAEDITLGVRLGADDYMSKPFDPAALVERVKELLAAPAA
jgi:CheY-like chemotaxis protein